MRKILLGIVLGVTIFSYGCAIHGVRSETGNPIPDDKVKQIVNGKTTSTEIFGLFGAPTQTSTIGNNEIYIYKNCKIGGTGISVAGIGHTGSKERCNSLSITVDKTTGIVQNYNYQKMFDAD
ncbi:MAG: hypothetical protein N2738_09540 [Thermodesulfovibrionales bacterium]|nr:hypothetical protein [Thermodesulfovibrionales bacterium]